MKIYNYIWGIIPPHLNDWLRYKIVPNTKKYDKSLLNRKKIFVFICADYANMGDIAITFSQINFLEKNFPEYKVIPHLISDIYRDMKSLKKIVNKDDIITMIGGGNNGCLYPGIEFCRLFVIQNFTNNLIVSFPQSISLSDGIIGNRILRKMKNIYGRHNHLVLCAREISTYKTYKEIFRNNNALLIPDIVLYNTDNRELFKFRKKDSILICRRSDAECNISDGFWKSVEDICKQFGRVTYQDTVLNKSYYDFESQYKDLNDMINCYREAGMVVTDRLHGMIFSYITGTPCIVFPSATDKICRSYDWIRECNFVFLLNDENIDEFAAVLDWASKIKELRYADLGGHFEMLSSCIRKEMNELRE